MKVKDLTGQRFGRLIVLARAENDRHNKSQWLCQCDCGNQKTVNGQSLTRGLTMSCGCLNREISSRKGAQNTQYAHGGHATRLYHVWHGMKSRCLNKSGKDYPRYGGRGITICDEWRGSFVAFRDWALANGYRDDLSIDRKDNDGPYAPWNCQWTTTVQQANNRRCTVEISVNGETLPLADWARKLGVSLGTLYCRYRKGWTPEEIVNGRPPKYNQHMKGEKHEND